MKYSDIQRVEKISVTTRKLLEMDTVYSIPSFKQKVQEAQYCIHPEIILTQKFYNKQALSIKWIFNRNFTIKVRLNTISSVSKSNRKIRRSEIFSQDVVKGLLEVMPPQKQL